MEQYSPEEPRLSDHEDELLFRAAGRRVVATVNGQPPETMKQVLGDIGRSPVYGVFVSLKRKGQLRSCCGVLGPTIPLYEAVDRAAQRAANDDPRFPSIVADELDELNMEVWLLWGVRPVETRGEHRAAAITIGTHGLIVSQGPKRGLLLPSVAVEHKWDAREFLKQVCRKAGLTLEAWKSDLSELMTFEGRAIRGPLQPDEQTTPQVRPAAVAGMFYPADPRQVRLELEQLFSQPPQPHPPQPQPWSAAMVPHAGWMYSGRLAAATLSQVEMPETVVVLCPKHRAGGATWSVAPHDVWALPHENVRSDRQLAMRLAGAIDGLEADQTPHAEEHAVEVLLPLLAHLAPDVRVVGISVGVSDMDDLLCFGDEMAGVLGGLPKRPLLVISSDLNHFADESETRHLDQLAIDAMESLDPAGLYQTVRENRISMCGVSAAVIVMQTLRRWGCLKRAELVAHTTSAETSGDTHRVVGYAGMLLGECIG